ncbi:tRNA dihydrouridine synthase DusB [Candidatus Deianiraea vastatrix]|uniref:tRNA-dihydrouridine synthase n=1 Tax=Candidatus Deianiraea vastatrix TaxID=2163644 RepID=A0A5B8XJ00_9RICK|nr:tRNA dihydrouridine synthase DusB [Candidatus Deianiraea vastatrix]QED23597.1 tRNA-dihydrouridine synthase [Candidatus Deianiraea vastatrix]
MKPIKIGNIVIENPVILAPMCGVTDAPYRHEVAKFGCGYTVSEMIASRAALLDLKNANQKAQRGEFEKVMAVQIAGFEADVMAEVAKKIADQGADIIDINFGCPVKKVVNGMAGSALMKHEDLATKIMESVVKAVSIPVTVKMRKGWNEENQNAAKLAKIAEDVGVKMVTIHGRTRAQLYDGKADWEFIRSVCDSVKIPVIVNGDIKNGQDARCAMEISGANGVMIGRATYGKPWLISQIIDELCGREVKIEPCAKGKWQIIASHMEGIAELYGKQAGVGIARKHLSWYSSGLCGSSEYRGRINQCNDFDEVMRMTGEFWGI